MMNDTRDALSAQISDLKDMVKENSRLWNDQQARYDITVKAEFAAVKSMMTDTNRVVNDKATKEDVSRLEVRVASLEKDRTKAEGAWWMALKIVAVVSGVVGAAAWVWEHVISKPPISQ